MRLVKTSICMLGVLFVLSVSAQAADAKIGLVDFQKILKESSAGKSAQAEVAEAGKKMETELKEKGDEIESLKSRIEREAMVMTKEQREERERDIRIKINDFKILQKKYIQDFKEHENRLVQKIKDDVMALVTEIGKKEGYTLILEIREAGAMYAPDKMEITDKVIERYNAQYAKQVGGAKQ